VKTGTGRYPFTFLQGSGTVMAAAWLVMLIPLLG